MYASATLRDACQHQRASSPKSASLREKTQGIVRCDKPPTIGSANQHLRRAQNTVLKRPSAKRGMLRRLYALRPRTVRRRPRPCKTLINYCGLVEIRISRTEKILPDPDV